MASFSQFSGLYQIGGDSADFSDLEQVLISIKSQGTSDTVTLILSDTTFSFNNELMNVNLEYPLYILGTKTDSTFSRVVPRSVGVQFHNCSNFHFREIIFDSKGQGHSLYLSYCTDFTLDNCSSIANTISGYALRVSHPEGNWFVQDCYFDGLVNLTSDANSFNLSRNVFKGEAKLSKVKARGNSFYMKVDGASYSTFVSNIFYGDFRLSHDREVKFYKNYCFGKVSIAFGGGNILQSNIFKSKVNFSFGYSHKIVNNHFYSSLRIGNIDNGSATIVYNNFHSSSNVYLLYYPGLVIKNNNLPKPISFGYGAPEITPNISNNNYFEERGVRGANLTFFDPQYISKDSMVTTNPLLSGMAVPISSIAVDFNDNDRGQNPTIGANEIWVDYDTSVIICSDKIVLNSSLNHGLSNVVWKPTTEMFDTSSSTPVISPSKSRTYYSISKDSITDSIHVIVKPFKLQMFHDQFLGCGSEGLLHDYVYPDTLFQYNWSPNDSVKRLNYHLWVADPRYTTSYNLELVHPRCGVFKDSITLIMDVQPIALGWSDSITYYGSKVKFDNISRCVDSLIWKFGDGKTSTDNSPTHRYETSGVYNWSLEVYNEDGADTFDYYVEILKTLDLSEINLRDAKLYPNPSNGTFTVEFDETIEIINITAFNPIGVIKRLNYIEKDKGLVVFNLDKVSSGIYIIQIQTSTGLITKKCILEKLD